MLYATGTAALSKLAIGTSTYILASSGTAPQWVAPSTIAIGTATNLAGGLANQIPYQTGPGVTTFMVAPTVANTYLEWSGSAFQWSSNPLGSVTSVSVVSANGFAGTVATATTTPAITLTTTITGLLKGNGTAISAATSGTDYAPATSGTSILYGNGAGGFSNVTIGTGVSFVGGTLSATGPGGTVTSVAALTLGTTGTDLSSTVANSTTTPVITLNVPTASATNRGALSAADWTTFNSKAPAFTYTTNYIPYGQGTTTPTQSANLTFNGSELYCNGNIGLGTASGFDFIYKPTATSTATGALYIQAGAGSGSYGANIVLYSHSNASYAGTVYLGKSSGATGPALIVGEGLGAGAEFMRINASGGVSIGNTTDAGANNLSVTGAITAASIKTTGSSVSASTATPTTLFTMSGANRGSYLVTALIANSGGPTQYIATATASWDGSGAKIVADNGINLTLTLSGGAVQVTQTAGSTQTVYFSYLYIGL
jgi:hypothetical protein